MNKILKTLKNLFNGKSKAPQGKILAGKEYNIIIEYSPRAKKKDLMKFTDKKGQKLVEISANDLIPIILENFTIEHMHALAANVKQVELIEVTRNIAAVCDRAFKKGEKINFPFKHKMPLEYAIAEEALNLVSISGDNVYKITRKELDAAGKSVGQGVHDFTEQANAEFLRKDKSEKKKAAKPKKKATKKKK